MPELIRKHGISRQTYFNWRAKDGGARVKDRTWLRELEAENAKLKRMYVELALENAPIIDVHSLMPNERADPTDVGGIAREGSGIAS